MYRSDRPLSFNFKVLLKILEDFLTTYVPNLNDKTYPFVGVACGVISVLPGANSATFSGTG